MLTFIQYSTKLFPPKRLVGIKELLEDLGIRTNGPYGPIHQHVSKSGIKTYGWMLQVSGQEDILRFAEKVNFTLPHKRAKLEQLLNSYKLPSRLKLRNCTRTFELTRMRKVKLSKELLRFVKEEYGEEITIRRIAKILGKSESWVAEVMRCLVNEGIVKVSKEKSPSYTFRVDSQKKCLNFKCSWKRNVNNLSLYPKENKVT